MVIFGLVLIWVMVSLDFGPYLKSAQHSYTECIELKAPREECLKKYLLPEEK